MNEPINDLIISLVESNKHLQSAVEMTTAELGATTKNVDRVANSVDKLIMMDAKREEREKVQVDKNKVYDHFIEEYRFPLNRLKLFYVSWDKYFGAIIGAIAAIILGLAGWNGLK